MQTVNGRTPGSALRRARHMLECGEIPPDGLVDRTVARSWRRSMDAGLLPFGRVAGGEPLAAAEIARAVERRTELVACARPLMEYLHANLRGSGSMVILGDDCGLLLDALGDPDFVGRAGRVALMPGASWSEPHRGTNAIGTALAEGGPVVVHGQEHFFEHNSFLTCAAAPVMGPDGRLLGVLDISGPRRGRHPHSFGLVRTAAHLIENRLFEVRHARAHRIRFHPRADGIGTVAEGLAALSEDGVVIGANRAGLALLGIAVADLGRIGIESCLRARFPDLADWGRRRPGTVMVAAGRDRRLFVRIEWGADATTTTVVAVRPSRQPSDALEALDTGDARMKAAIDRARRVVDKPIPLLLHGESGVGKEVFAKALHASGTRCKGPFVAVNCAALPEQLIEAELFGYGPGAFTGARRDGNPGRLREAHGGTLFLDEIGDMPLALQGRLLRVLQDREVVPLGGGRPVTVDFSVVAATNRPLRAEVEAGRFRADLYYRLNGLTLTLPPLRERGDFGILVDRILDSLEPGKGIMLTPDVAAAFATHSWPGNIRQLANALRTACALLEPGEGWIGWETLPEDLVDELRRPSQMPRTDGGGRMLSLRDASDRAIGLAVQQSGGNLSEAARTLGISRNTLYRRMKQVTKAAPSL